MASRLNLHEELCEILGTRNVYFQPPESIKLVYPCIVYTRSGIYSRKADSLQYNKTGIYTITTIDRDPDSELPEKILEHFQMCSFDRGFASDNLNHNVLTLYY
jgi:hypothetical protein